MACVLPTPDKFWTYYLYTVNTGSDEGDARQAIFDIKNILKTTFGWTIAGSSNAATAGMDGVDRWDTIADVISVYSSGNHSWIVFQSPTGQQILWNNVRSQPSSLLAHVDARMYWSPLPDFSGGSISTRPSSPNEYTTNGGGGWLASNYTSANVVVYFMQSTDGKHFRWFTNRNGEPYAKWLLDEIVDPVVTFAVPQISWMSRPLGAFVSQGPDVNSANYATLHDAEQGKMRLTDGGQLLDLSLACEMTVSDSVGQRVTVSRDIDSCSPILPTIVVCGTPGYEGVVGRIPDVWLGRESVVNGTTYPGDDTHQFHQHADIIVPWNGTLPQVS